MFVKEIKQYLFNRTILLLFICAFLLFVGRWFFSYFFFNEEIGIKIILESPSDGYFFYPFVKFFSILDFNNSYDPNINNLKNIPFPLYGIFLHSFFFKIFGSFGFIISELFCIFLFIIIFYFIFKKFNFSKIVSIILTLFLFVLPILLEVVNLKSIMYLSNLEQFYNLRFQSPLVVNLVLFYFVLFLLDLSNKEIFQVKNFVILGFILAFSFTSFYYHFIIEVLSFFIFLIYKLNFKISSIFKNKIKFYLISFFIFLILSSPFIINMIYAEADFSERMGIINIDLDKKFILLNYLFKKLIKIEFLIVFISISTLIYFINKYKFENYYLNNILYIIFLSSILAPFIFIIFTPKISLIYHFTNLILIFAFLCLLFLFVNFLKKYINRYFVNKNFLTFIILLIIFIYNINIFYSYKSKYENQAYTSDRKYLSLVTKKIRESQLTNKDLSLLTLDPRLMVWSIMNDVRDIRLISGQLVSKTHDMIENDLILSFKFLNKSEDDFINFFKNEKKSWRYLNTNTQLFFWMRYSANSLKTHKESKDFESDTLKFILNTSPLTAQSLIIPESEFKRLRLKFRNFNEANYKKPDIISINNQYFKLREDLNILTINYCSDNLFNPFIMYKLKYDGDICEN